MTLGRYSGQEDKKYYLPSDGMHQAVFVDYELLPGVEVTFDGKTRLVDQIRYYFLLDEYGDDGKAIIITHKMTDKLYVPKPGRKAPNQYTFLSSWRGKPFTNEEISDFDQEQLIGVNAQIITEVKTFPGGREWPFILSVKPVKKDAAKLEIPKDYVRKKDRVPPTQDQMIAKAVAETAPDFGPAGAGGIGEVDEDIPF